MKNFKKLILFVFTFNFSYAFAGNLICEFEGHETEVSYTYDDNEPEVIQVSPSISAYTVDCDSLSCDLYFASFGVEDQHYGFSKAESVRHSVGDEEVRCQDTGIGAIEEDVNDAIDSAVGAIDKAADDVGEVAEDIGRGTERVIKDVGRTIENLF